MENLVVGNADCKFSDVVAIMSQSPAIGVFNDKFFDVAMVLGTPAELCKRLRRDIIIHGTKSHKIGLFELLVDWRGREGEKAKLTTFLEILEAEQIFDPANLLREQFSVSRGTGGSCQVVESTLNVKQMIAKQSNHIDVIMPRLIERMSWNAMISAELIATNILSKVESMGLDAMQNPADRTRSLFTLIQDKLSKKRPGMYEEVIAIFEKHRQTGLAELLEDM